MLEFCGHSLLPNAFPALLRRLSPLDAKIQVIKFSMGKESSVFEATNDF